MHRNKNVTNETQGGNTKLDPKFMLAIASKLMQQQQQQPQQRGSVADATNNVGLNLFTQLLNNAPLASALLNNAMGGATVDPSLTIYRNYVELTSPKNSKLPNLRKFKVNSAYPNPSGKVRRAFIIVCHFNPFPFQLLHLNNLN